VADLPAQVRAAIQQVWTSEPHDTECIVLSQARFSGGRHEFGVACNCTQRARVDARLAACVEAMVEEGVYAAFLIVNGTPSANWRDEALAAFVARAAQEDK
jgi:hypothetical protein